MHPACDPMHQACNPMHPASACCRQEWSWSEEELQGHCRTLQEELLEHQAEQSGALETDEVQFGVLKMDEVLRGIACSDCNGCELTALALAKVCEEWLALCAAHKKICEQRTGIRTAKVCDAKVCDEMVSQIRSVIEAMGVNPTPERQAQGVAELQESLNIVELHALTLDPDLLASVPGLEQLMDAEQLMRSPAAE